MASVGKLEAMRSPAPLPAGPGLWLLWIWRCASPSMLA